MTRCLVRLLTGTSLLAAAAALADGRLLEISYPPSDTPGELSIGVTYRLWIPEDTPVLRGIVVHQHGCGTGACRGGETAADDLHWQALARRHDCALLGPSYHQGEDDNCQVWSDPRNGSDARFRQALAEFALRSGHQELEQAPWVLWGHSGGGFWASLMLGLHPDRIAAVWLRSGTAFNRWNTPGDLVPMDYPEAAFQIPIACNPGAREETHERFHVLWDSLVEMHAAFRARGAPVAFAVDPKSSHECGDSRYFAIPFLDACMKIRLPEDAEAPLRPVDMAAGWLVPPLASAPPQPASTAGEDDDSSWLPTRAIAEARNEYIGTGLVTDDSPPPAPIRVSAVAQPDGSWLVEWDAHADPESGIRQFVVVRNGSPIAHVPEEPVGRHGRPLFQSLSYHDTPEKPLPPMRFVDRDPGRSPGYAVITVNGAGQSSGPTPAAP